MAKGDNLTKKQHYIPQVYLRGFSPKYEKVEVNSSRYTVYCYDLEKDIQMLPAVPIKSICYEDLLYEVTDNQSQIILPNYLEKFFSSMEKMFGEYRTKLERKAFIRDNYYKKCFLTKEEKNFWLTYMTLQLLRLPQILKEGEELSLETWNGQISENQAKNIARLCCLPFFKEWKEGADDSKIIEAIVTPMLNMSFAIGVDRTGSIITSDKPVYVYSPSYLCKEYERIIFPITSKICLFLFGGEDKKNYPKNILFPIDKEILEEIIKSVTEAAFGKIYANHKLSQIELQYIHEVMKDKSKEKIDSAIF